MSRKQPLLGPIGSVALGTVLLIMLINGSLWELIVRLGLAWGAYALVKIFIASQLGSRTSRREDTGLSSIVSMAFGIAMFAQPLFTGAAMAVTGIAVFLFKDLLFEEGK